MLTLPEPTRPQPQEARGLNQEQTAEPEIAQQAAFPRRVRTCIPAFQLFFPQPLLSLCFLLFNPIPVFRIIRLPAAGSVAFALLCRLAPSAPALADSVFRAACWKKLFPPADFPKNRRSPPPAPQVHGTRAAPPDRPSRLSPAAMPWVRFYAFRPRGAPAPTLRPSSSDPPARPLRGYGATRSIPPHRPFRGYGAPAPGARSRRPEGPVHPRRGFGVAVPDQKLCRFDPV